MDKLAALRTFRAVVEQQSFSRAARALGLSNAATSKHVRELEEVLGAQLLQRTTRRMSLTATGRSYYEHIVAALEALAEADRSARDQAATPRGTLRVAAPMTLGLTGVSSAIAAFSLTHPQVELELSLDDRVVDLVREGFDVCIRGGGALPDSDLVARKLVNLERVVVAAPSYLGQAGTPRTPADLAAHRCLVYSLSASPTRWTFTRQAERQSVDVAGPLRVNNSLALVQAVVVGLGVALVPMRAVHHELSDGRVIALLRDWKTEPQWLQAIHTRHRQKSRLLRAFVEHLAVALNDAA